MPHSLKKQRQVASVHSSQKVTYNGLAIVRCVRLRQREIQDIVHGLRFSLLCTMCFSILLSASFPPQWAPDWEEAQQSLWWSQESCRGAVRGV